MTLHFDVNNGALTGPQAMFKLKTLLVAAGWVVRSSGDGLSAFSSSGDVITSGSGGAGGLANTSAWFVIEMPAANSVNRQLMIQRNATNLVWTVKYSYSAKFTGGSPSSTVPGTATDSQTLLNGANFFGADNGYRWNAAADDAAPYGFWAGAFPNGGGNPSHAFLMLPLVQTDSLDTDPYLFYVSGTTSCFGSTEMINGNLTYAWFRKGMTNERWNSPGTSGGQVFFCTYFTALPTTVIPSAAGPNPHNGNDDSFMIPVASFAQITSGQAYWPGGFKGFSSTFLRWNGSSRTTGDTISIASAGAKDWIVYRDTHLPWNGSTPTV